VLTLAVAAVAAVAFIAGRWLGAVADWYPYPSPTWPPVDTVMVAACLLLATPALVRRGD
jgi:hypothetical protein